MPHVYVPRAAGVQFSSVNGVGGVVMMSAFIPANVNQQAYYRLRRQGPSLKKRKGNSK